MVTCQYYCNVVTCQKIIFQRDILDGGWPSWFDITSQKSQSLPAEFRNSADQSDFGHTIYEADANTIYNTPFTSRTNFTTSDMYDATTAVFYAPRNDSVVASICFIGPSENGSFSAGMQWGFSYSEWSFIN